MLNTWESRWRYPVAVFIGGGAGLYIGAMLATVYLMFIFGENFNL